MGLSRIVLALMFALPASATTPELFAADVREFALSTNNKKLFFHKTSSEAAGDMFVVDATPKAPTDLSKAIVVVNNWQLSITRRNTAQKTTASWPHRAVIFGRAKVIHLV